MNLINLVTLTLALGLASSARADPSLSEGVTAPRELPTDPAVIMDTLFGKIELEEPLKASETLELLKRLVEEQKEAIPADKLEQVEYLYSVGQVDKSKCDYEAFKKLEEALVSHKQLRASILPYLKQVKEQLWDDVCRLKLQNQVADVVNKYDKESVRDLFLLTKINLEEGDKLWTGFADNVATFIHYKLDDQKADPKELQNKEKFLNIYKEIIGGACERPMSELAPMMRVYDLLFPDGDGRSDNKYAQRMADQLIRGVGDGLTMWWISTVRICRELVENDAQLISQDAQSILTASDPMGLRIKNFFGGLFKPKNKA